MPAGLELPFLMLTCPGLRAKATTQNLIKGHLISCSFGNEGTVIFTGDGYHLRSDSDAPSHQ